MKKLVLSLGLILLITACKDNSKQEKVSVPLQEDMIAETPEMGKPSDVKVDEGGQFQMEALAYEYNALEPHIDEKTMFIHFSKHHLGYANNLNKAIAETPLANLSIEEILAKLDLNNAAVRNNGGGYYNHNMFWKIIGPNKGGMPTDTLSKSIDRDFTSFDNFKGQFVEAATKQFGSGWAWLMADKSGKLTIVTTPNQDNPLMGRLGIKGGKPIMCVDVWEHAYYLKYQNKRKDYLEAFFNVVDWKKVSENYLEAMK